MLNFYEVEQSWFKTRATLYVDVKNDSAKLTVTHENVITGQQEMHLPLGGPSEQSVHGFDVEGVQRWLLNQIEGFHSDAQRIYAERFPKK